MACLTGAAYTTTPQPLNPHRPTANATCSGGICACPALLLAPPQIKRPRWLQPNNAANGITGVQTASAASGMGFAGNIVCTSNLPDKIAIAVDTQMDDATANSGQIRGDKQDISEPGCPGSHYGTYAYAETGTNTYLLCKSL